MKKIKLIFLLLIGFTSYIWAQEEEYLKHDKEKSPHHFTGNLTLISDYRSRGISQTMRRPAVQGELRYAHQSGFYAKTWASNVDGTGIFINNTSLEWDFYLGYKTKLPKTPFEIDAGFEYYYYPGGEAFLRKHTSYDSLEYYIQVNYGKFNFVFHQTLTDYFGINSDNPPMNWNKRTFLRSRGHSLWSAYFELNWEIPLNKTFKLTLHSGYQTITHYAPLNYFDWLVMLTYDFNPFEITLTYVGTNAKRAYYDVPDHSFHSNRRIHLGTSGVNIALIRKF